MAMSCLANTSDHQLLPSPEEDEDDDEDQVKGVAAEACPGQVVLAPAAAALAAVLAAVLAATELAELAPCPDVMDAYTLVKAIAPAVLSTMVSPLVHVPALFLATPPQNA